MTWTVLGDSVAGTSHHTSNTPCQDAFRHRTFGATSEWLVIAVADGAGSASCSQAGATVACDEFIRRVEARESEFPLSRDGMIELFSEVRSDVVTEAERLNVRPRDMACTAMIAIVGPTSACFAQIGDGVMVIGDGATHRTVFWPEPSEYVNTTDFLTDDRFADSIRFETLREPIYEIAALTDGLQRLCLDFAERQPHAAFFRPMFASLRTASNLETLSRPFHEFLDSTLVNSRTDDDKTLVLAVRQP